MINNLWAPLVVTAGFSAGAFLFFTPPLPPPATAPKAMVGVVYAVTPDGRGPNLGDFTGTPDRDPKTGWVRWVDKRGAVHMSPAVMEFVASGP